MSTRSQHETPRSQNEHSRSHNEHQEVKATQINNPDGFQPEKVRNISSLMNGILADVFALYVKTKNFHWHMSGPHFRDYHLLLDEQGEQIFAMTDDVAERVRKIGGLTIHSIGEIARLQRIHDNDQEYVEAQEMLRELHGDNMSLVESLRAAHKVTDEAGDYATTSLIENWIDESERRAWFLFEATR
jgi:starvation-inducible DNA-binding protein